jgi:hypothetical protein
MSAAELGVQIVRRVLPAKGNDFAPPRLLPQPQIEDHLFNIKVEPCGILHTPLAHLLDERIIPRLPTLHERNPFCGAVGVFQIDFRLQSSLPEKVR